MDHCFLYNRWNGATEFMVVNIALYICAAIRYEMDVHLKEWK